MNNPAMNGPPQRAMDARQLIKPDQVLKIPFLDEATKQRTYPHVQGLWATLQNSTPNSKEQTDAYESLFKISQGIKNRMQQQKANAARPASAGQPASQAQPTPQRPQVQQAQAPQQPQQAPAGAPNNAGQQAAQQLVFTQKVLDRVKAHDYAIPLETQQQGSTAVQNFTAQARKRYATHLQSYENALQNIERMEKLLANRLEAGKPALSAQDEQAYQHRRKQLEAHREEARVNTQKFMWEQNQIRQEQGQQNPQAQAVGEQMRRHQSQNGGVTSTTQGQSGPAHTVSSALDAARSHSDASEKPKTATMPEQKGPTPVNQASNSQQATQNSSTQVQPMKDTKPGEATGIQRPGLSQNQAGNHPQPPGQAFPLSHEAAMQQARSYSHQNVNAPYQQTTNQHPPHGHPTQQKTSTSNEPGVPSHAKMNIPKDLNIPPPQPVPMPPARPTLTGGPFPAGPIGQPAIQRHPGYVLEGDGERVLSKKKLEELIRQVSGSTGEGEDGETMSPEVEEVRSAFHTAPKWLELMLTHIVDPA